MSVSGRKRISKWDLKEVPQLSPGYIQNDAGPGKAGKLVPNKELQPAWCSPAIAGSNGPKWYGEEANNKDGREFLDAPLAWDGDVSCSTKMSPGLDDWRQQKHNRSPKRDWGISYRSRSRSPPCDFKRESGSNDRSILAQPCKDFAAGRCGRDHCPYLHQDDSESEDRRYSEDGLTDSWEGRHRTVGASKYFSSDHTWECPISIRRCNNLCNDFLKGTCVRGASCNYAHHSAACDGISKGSAKEIFREWENVGSNRGASLEHRNHEPHRSGHIPCKFFASGNCRNGEFCRFSHHCHTPGIPNDRSQDEWRQRSNNSDNVDRREGLKWIDTSVSDVAKLPEWNVNRNGNVGVPEQGTTAWPMDDRWEPVLDTNKRSLVHPTDNNKAVESSGRECLHLKAENTGAGMGVSESRGAEIWHGDMEISPVWNYRLPSSNHIFIEEPGHITKGSQLTCDETVFQTCQHDGTQEVNEKHQTVAAVQPLISQNSCSQMNFILGKDAADALSCEDRKATKDSAMSLNDLNISASFHQRQGLDQNGQSLTAVNQPLSGLNAVGQNQQTFAPYAPREEFIANAQNQRMFQELTSLSKSDVMNTNRSDVISEIPSTQYIVRREQLSQLINLSASLAQLFGTGQQLPQLYAALNGSNSMDCMALSLTDAAVPVALSAAASSQPSMAIGSQKLYDPICDSVELIKPNVSSLQANIAPDFVVEKSVADEKPEIASKKLFPSSVTGGPSGSDLYTTGNLEVEFNDKSHQLNKPDSVANCKGEEKNGISAEESKKGQDSGAVEKIDGDGRADESKKNNDGKGIRAFKFALAEFVKELLKPTWKEGQLNKEAHKTIVKKVVDKVTGSIQGIHVPQSQEKIDHYLSSSKPKLSKLVQAYVEKYQKS